MVLLILFLYCPVGFKITTIIVLACLLPVTHIYMGSTESLLVAPPLELKLVAYFLVICSLEIFIPYSDEC